MATISLPSPPRNILIIKPSAVGDVVHGLPVLALLKRHWPEAKFSWLVTPACAGILDGHPHLHEVIRFDRKAYGKSWRSPGAARSLLEFTRSLKERKFDLVIDLQGLFRSGWLTRATAAPVRIGLSDAREGAHLFYTHRVDVGSAEQHAIERYLRVPDALGAGREPAEFRFPTDDADRDFVRALTPARYALLLPGTNWITKRWPARKFAALVRPLKDRFGLETVLGGAPNETELADDVLRMADARYAVTNLVGQTNLRQLVALIERAAVVIANDSGPMHIAAALGRPMVSLFGPTNPVRTGPYRRAETVLRVAIECSPCYSRQCSHVSCLEWLDADAVVRAVSGQLAAG